MRKSQNVISTSSSVEEAWLFSGAHHNDEFTESIFLKLANPETLKWDLPIREKVGEGETTLLREWMAFASHWSNAVASWAATSQGQTMSEETVWNAIQYALTSGHGDHVDTACSAWLQARPDVWEANQERVAWVFQQAVDRNLTTLQKVAQDKQGVDVNATIVREKDDWNQTKTLLGSASTVGAIKELLNKGADPFLKPKNAPRAWDEWTKKQKGRYVSNDRQRQFARDWAVETMLVTSPTPAEDIWAALSTASTVAEKATMIKKMAKKGFWAMRSNKQGKTQGATSLMYLASQGELNAKGILNLVPESAWKDVDEQGRTPAEYVWAAWAGGSGKVSRDLDGMPPLTAEQQAGIVYHHLTRHGEVGKGSQGFVDTLLLSPPQVIRSGSHSEQSIFWNTLLSKPNAIQWFFEAVLATPRERPPHSDESQATPKITSEEDWKLWCNALLTAEHPEGGLWVEKSTTLNHACTLLLWREKTSVESQWGTSEKEAAWDDSSGRVLTKLANCGGSVRLAFETKDKACFERKAAFEALPPAERDKYRYGRRSQLEEFNSLPKKRKSQELFNQWVAFGEKFELKARVENQLGEKIGKGVGPAL